MQQTCPLNLIPDACTAGPGFTIGAGDNLFNTPMPPANNTFYDYHVTQGSGSLLDIAGLASCIFSCSQTYSCTGRNIGSFIVTSNLTKSTISGTPVTRVSVTKQ